MAAFNLTAQLQLQAPNNIPQVVSAIRKQLAPIGIKVNVTGDPRSLAQINQQLQSTQKYAKNSARSIGELNRTLQESARRFSVITLATGTLLSLAAAFKNSVRSAIDFEKSMVNLSQVTGKTTDQLKPLADEVTKLATTLGTSSKDLIDAAQTLAQAGFSAEKTKKALDILAQTTLASSFGSITETTEGAIAALSQFTSEATSTGAQIQFLENTLNSINAVSKAFAVESSDLVTVIRRTGGVFAAAGGSVEELIALFTSVRATTRESAETIATGLRTIFTRIQRPETIDQLKQLGIELQDSEGKFVGAYEAVKRLSAGLSALDPKDIRFSGIVEELGGFRQVGKVIPLIKQFAVAQDALNVAQSASGSIAEDARIAQQSLANQIVKLREEFDALIRKFAASETFRSLAGGAIELARAFIKVADSLEPLLPLITSLFALKLGSGLAPAIASFAGIGSAARGGLGRVSKFARGGMVPGSGSGDTVPAMLTPGEFVIRKSSVKKLGASTLHAMNQNRFEKGKKINFSDVRQDLEKRRQTKIAKEGETYKSKKLEGSSVTVLDSVGRLSDEVQSQLSSGKNLYGAAFLRPEAQGQIIKGSLPPDSIANAIRGNKRINTILSLSKRANDNSIIAKLNKEIPEIINAANSNKFLIKAGSLTATESSKLEETLLKGITNTVKSGASQISNQLKFPSRSDDVGKLLKTINVDNIVGNLFEGVLSSAGGFWRKRVSNASFDFPNGLKDLSSKFGLSDISEKPSDAKSTFTADNISSFTNKVKNFESQSAIDKIDKVIKNSGLIEKIQQIKGTELKPNITRTSQELGLNITPRMGKRGEDPFDPVRNLVESTKPTRRRASGGGISGSDTVPALLTPGEFVVNKKSASRIGYGNLARMNKTGVAHFARGGFVGVQRFAGGGTPLPSHLDPDRIMNRYGSFFNPAPLPGGVKNYGPGGGITPEAKSALNDANTVFKDLGLSAKMSAKALKIMYQEMKKGEDVSKSFEKAVHAINEELKNKPKAQPQITAGMALSQGLDKIQNVANAAQNFVFLGASIAAVTSQMSSLDDATKKAINQTAGFAAAVVGIGSTLVNTISSLVQTAISSRVLSAASLNTAKDITILGGAAKGASNIQNLTKGAQAVNASFQGLTAVLISTAAVYGYYEYQQNLAAAKAEELGKAFDDAIEKFRSTGEIDRSSIIDKQLQQVAKEQEAVAYSSAKAAGGLTALLSGITTLAIGIAVLATGLIPFTFGTSLAVAAIAGLVAVLAGGVAAQLNYNSTLNQSRSSLDSFRLSIESSTNILLDLIEAGRNFDEKIKEIDLDKFLSPEQKTRQKIFAQERLGASLTEKPIPGIDFAEGATFYKQSIDALSGIASRRGGTIADIQNKEKRKDLGVTEEEGKIIDLYTDRIKEYSSQMAKSLQQARDNFFEIAQSDLGVQDLDTVLKDSTTALGRAYQDYKAALEYDAKQRIDLLNARYNNEKALAKKYSEDAVAAASTGKPEDAAKAENLRKLSEEAAERAIKADEQRRLEEAKLEQKQKDVKKSLEDQNAKIIENNRARIAEFNAMQKLRGEIEESQRIGGVLKRFIDTLDKNTTYLENQQTTISNIAGSSGQRLKISAPKIQEIGNVTDVRNRDVFNREINLVASRFGKAGEEYANRVKKNSELFDKASKELITAPRFGATDKDTKKQAEDILAKAGIDESIGKDLYQTLLKNIIDKLSKGGEIKAEDAAQLLDPLKKVLEEDAKRLQEFQDLYQKEIDNYSKYIDAVDEYRKRELEGLANVASTIIRAIDIRARATGREEEAGFAKELIRTLAAQQQLNVAGAGRGGAGAVAGNLGSLAAARRSAMGMLTGITDEINRLENGGGPEGEARKTRLQELMAAESKQRSIIEATNKELERLADQSEKVADIQSRIEKEQRKRGQIKDFVKDFVTSGQEQRMSTMNAIQGLNVAYSQGTLQVLDEETRKAVAGLLESLSEVQLPGGGGATGKQILDEFILRDAFAAGFPPEWIQALRGATTQEQRLINALGALTDQMVMASRIRAEMPKAPIPVNVVNLDELKKREAIKSPEKPPSEFTEPKPFETDEDTKKRTDNESDFKNKKDQIEKETEIWRQNTKEMMDQFRKDLIDLIKKSRETAIRDEARTNSNWGPGATGFGMATGGFIKKYNDGGSIFQPSGTDTVPAMLTPGEYVVRKSAVDKVGVGTLDAINNGTLYASKGDIVPGARYYGDGGFVLPFPETGLDTKEAEENRKAVLKHIEQQKDKVSTQAQNAYNQWIDKALQKRLKQIDPLAEWRDEMLNNETLKRQREELILPTDDQAYQVWKKTNKLGQGFMPKITMSSPPSIGGRRMYPKAKPDQQKREKEKKDELIRYSQTYTDKTTGEVRYTDPEMQRNMDELERVQKARQLMWRLQKENKPVPEDVRKLALESTIGRDLEERKQERERADELWWKTQADKYNIELPKDEKGRSIIGQEQKDKLREIFRAESKAKKQNWEADWARIREARARKNGGYGQYGGYGGGVYGSFGSDLIPAAAAGAFDKNTGIQPVLPGGAIPNDPLLGARMATGAAIPKPNDLSIITGPEYVRIMQASMRNLQPQKLMQLLTEYGTIQKGDANGFLKQLSESKDKSKTYDQQIKDLVISLNTQQSLFHPARNVLDAFVDNKDLFSSADASGLTLKAPQVDIEQDPEVVKQQLSSAYNNISRGIGNIISTAVTPEEINNETANKILENAGVQPILKQAQTAFYSLLQTKKFIDSVDPNDVNALKTLHKSFIGEKLNISAGLSADELINAKKYNEIEDIIKDISVFNFAKGGKVGYFSGGGSLFKPKGTDTVPAMLTPGEFVISKPAVDKIGIGTLNAINDGTMYASKGGPVYFKGGGRVVDDINKGLQSFVNTLKKINSILNKFADSVSTKSSNLTENINTGNQNSNALFNVVPDKPTRITMPDEFKRRDIQQRKEKLKEQKTNDDFYQFSVNAKQSLDKAREERNKVRQEKADAEYNADPAIEAKKRRGRFAGSTNLEAYDEYQAAQKRARTSGKDPNKVEFPKTTIGGKTGKSSAQLRYEQTGEMPKDEVIQYAPPGGHSYFDPKTGKMKYDDPRTQERMNELERVQKAIQEKRKLQKEGKEVPKEVEDATRSSPEFVKKHGFDMGASIAERQKKRDEQDKRFWSGEAKKHNIPVSEDGTVDKEGKDKLREIFKKERADKKAKVAADWERYHEGRARKMGGYSGGMFPQRVQPGFPSGIPRMPQLPGAPVTPQIPGAPVTPQIPGAIGTPQIPGMPDANSIGTIIGKIICECLCGCIKELIGSIVGGGGGRPSSSPTTPGSKEFDFGSIVSKAKDYIGNFIDYIKVFGSKLTENPIIQKLKDFATGIYDAYQTWNKIKEGAAKVKEKAQPITDLGKSIWDEWKKKQQEKEDNTPSPSDKPMEDLPKPRPKLPSTTLPNLGIGPIPIPDQQPESKPEIEASPVDINRTPQGIETGVIPNIQDIISNNIAAGMQRADSSAQPKLENNVEIPRLSSNKSPVIPNKLWESVSEAVRKSTDVMMNNLPDTNLSGENIVDTIIKRYKNQKTQTPKTQAQRKNVPLQDEDGPSPSDNLRPGGIFNVPDTRVERIKPFQGVESVEKLKQRQADRKEQDALAAIQAEASQKIRRRQYEREDKAKQQRDSNPAMRALREDGVLPTDYEMPSLIADQQAVRKSVGLNPYDADWRITRGGKYEPRKNGAKPMGRNGEYVTANIRDPYNGNMRYESEGRPALFGNTTFKSYTRNPLTGQTTADNFSIGPSGQINNRQNESYAPRINRKTGETIEHPEVKKAQEAAMAGIRAGTGVPGARNRQEWQNLANTMGIPTTDKDGKPLSSEARRDMLRSKARKENQDKYNQNQARREEIQAYRRNPGTYSNRMYGPQIAPGTLPQAETGAGMGGLGAPIGGLGGGFGGPMGMPDPRSLGDIIGRTICECLCKCIKEAIMSITSMGGGIGGGGMGGLGGAMGGSGGPFGFINSIIDIGKSLYEKFKQTKIFESISSLFGGGEKTSAEPTPWEDGDIEENPLPLESLPFEGTDTTSLDSLDDIINRLDQQIQSETLPIETPQEKPTTDFGSMLGKGVGDFLSSGINKVGEIFTGIKDTFQTIVTPTTTPTASMAPSTSGGWMFGGGAGMNMIPPDLFSRMMPQQPQNIDLCRCVSESIRNAESNYKMAEGGAGRGRERFMTGPEQPKVVEMNNTGGYMAMATPKEEGKGSIAGDLDAFASNISNVFSGITSTFTGFMNSLDSFVERFTGFKFEHNVTVEGLISIGGLNIESISSEITESISDLVTQEVKRQLNDKPFDAG